MATTDHPVFNPLRDRLNAAHFDGVNQCLVEPIKRLDFAPVSSNPGGDLTLWQSSVDGHLRQGNYNDLSASTFASNYVDTTTYARTHAVMATFYEIQIPAAEWTTFTTNTAIFNKLASPNSFRLGYTGDTTRVFRITANLSFGLSSATAQFLMQIRVNGVAVSAAKALVNTTTSVGGSQTITQMVTLTPNDYVSIFTACTGGTTDANIIAASLLVD